MALNIVIIKKVREKTESEPTLGNFIIDLLKYESEPHGWYNDKYRNLIEKACKEGEQSANS